MSLVCVQDYEEKAKEILPKSSFEFFRSGACTESTMKWNTEAYRKIRLRPRVLRDVSVRSTECNVLGCNFAIPVGIAPTAMHKMAHPDGEIATAKAAGVHKTVYIMSTASTTSIEELGAAAPDTIKWLQLYVFSNRSMSENLIRRAEACDYKAIVITADLPVAGSRWADARNNFSLPQHLSLPNFSNIDDNLRAEHESGVTQFARTLVDSSLTWEDIKKFVRFCKVPVILKGVLTVDDALLAIDAGCKGIIVSNHGGRQLDGAQPTIEVLPEIVRAVGDKSCVMLDGGITNGLDVYKALALGAKMVFIGRAAIWGLAVDGQKGVEKVLGILKNELDIGMGLCGTPTIGSITRDYVISANENSKL